MIAANWKMNKNSNDVSAYFKAFQKQEHKVPTLFFVSPVLLQKSVEAVSSSAIEIGAQNIYLETSGAFTGETSVDQVKATGATWVLIGHSERRSLFGETSEQTNKKMKLAIESKLRPMLCVGETLEQREGGQTMAVITEQLSLGLKDISMDDLLLSELVIAYEPVWAIGTGKVATLEQAHEVHGEIRQLLSEMGFSKAKILYGGSVKSGNAAELMSDNEIDGVLVGGASLDASEFCKISDAARESLLDN